MAKKPVLGLQKPTETHESNRPEERQISPAVGTGNEDALKRREAIADGADSARNPDLGDIQDDGTVVPRETSPEPEAIEQEQPASETTQVVEPVKKFKVPILGKMVEMTEEELIATAAKVSSGDEYLRAAKESVKTAANVALSPTDVPQKDMRALARAIQMGTEEEAEQALLQLVKVEPSKTPDVRQVVRSELTLQEKVAKFEEDYKDVLTDPNLKRLVYEREAELSAGTTEPNPENWRKAGDEIREWTKGFRNVSSQTKLERKASVSPVPTAAGRQQTVSDEEAEDTPQDAIRKMAEARGQGRPISH